eukprot:s178_g39.t1
MQQGSEGCDPICVGHVLVYVDDIMALAKDDVRQSFFERLQQEWKCSDVETVDQTNWVRFCGFELKRYVDGVSLTVGQKSYTAELLKRHETTTPKTCPMLKPEHDEPPEENMTTEDIRAAQTITGELLRLAGRSRPDLAYVVGAMGRQVSKKPKWVQRTGEQVLGFLQSTQDTCLVYRPCSKDHGVLGTLQVPRHERLLEAFADISFAPNGDRSHQGIIVCAAGSPIQWEASRQAFHTMSTAEAELVGYCEAATMLKSVEALMKDETEENDPLIKKIKAIVCIAALSTAAASKTFADELRLKCAKTVLVLAKWLAANWCTPPSDEGRSKEGCPKFPRAKLAAISSKPKALGLPPPLTAAAASSSAAGAKPKPKPPLPPTEDAASSSADGAKSKPKQPSLPAKAAAAAAEDVTNVKLAAENAARERPKAKPAKKMPPLMMRWKRDTWSLTKCNLETYLVKVHKTPRCQRFHPLHRNPPVSPQYLSGERVTKAWFVEGGTEEIGFLVCGHWANPVVRSATKWIGYTFLKVKSGAEEEMHLKTEPEKVDVASLPKADNQESLRAHVGLKSELETPRRTRPHGRLVTSQGVVASNSRTLFSGESGETTQLPTSVPIDETTQSIGYAKGGIIERGRAAVESMSSASSSSPPPWDWNPFLQPSVPKSFEPVTEDWPSSEIWSLVTDVEDAEEEEDENANNMEQA